VLTWLILAFGVAVAMSGWMIRRVRRLSLEWRVDTLGWRDRRGEAVVRSVHELKSVRRSPLGWIVLDFSDGASVKLDEHAQGCGELIAWLAHQRPDLLPGSAQERPPG
jgi:hypothetical protein